MQIDTISVAVVNKAKVISLLSFTSMLLAMLLFSFSVSPNSKRANFVFTSSVWSQPVTTQSTWDTVPIEEVTVSYYGNSELMPGQSIDLSITTTPEYAIKTATNVEYQFISGSYLATITHNVLTVNTNAAIGGQIVVGAVVDGTVSTNTLTFIIVKIPATSIIILNTETQIEQNRTLQLKTQVLPNNASYRQVVYSIPQGSQYATVDNSGLIKVNNNLSSGNLQITVRATNINDSTIYDEKEFLLYVPTRTLSLQASTNNPVVGSQVNLTPAYSQTATQVNPTWDITDGIEFVESISPSGILKIKDNILADKPEITVNCRRDGFTSNTITLKVYIPTKSIIITANTATIKQESELQFNIETIPANATRDNLTFYLNDTVSTTINAKTGKLISYINNNIQSITVEVYAQIDDIISRPFNLIIEKPVVEIFTDKQNPISSETFGGTVNLSTKVDDILTANKVRYAIVSGTEFVEIFNGTTGELKIKDNIIVRNPEIIVSTQYSGFSPVDIKINPYIPTRSIILSAENNKPVVGSEVKVKTALSSYATESAPTYIIISGAEFIDGDILATGSFKIKNTINTFKPQIEIQATRDGVPSNTITYSIYIPTESIVVVANRNTIKQGESLSFNIETIPINATRDNLIFYLSDNINSTIGEKTGVLSALIRNQTLTSQVQVFAGIDNIVSQPFTLIIEKPNTVLTADNYTPTSSLISGETIHLTVAVDGVVTTTGIVYSITSGNEFVDTLSQSGILIIKNDIQVKNPQITVNAQFSEFEPVEIIIAPYIPTRELELSSSEQKPIRGTTFTLNTQMSTFASIGLPIWNVESGNEFIESISAIGEVTVKNNITAYRPQIVLSCTRDGITSKPIIVEIYIPTESIVISASETTIRQERQLQFSVTTMPINATRDNLIFYLGNTGHAAIDTNGLLTSFIKNDVMTVTIQVYAQIDGKTDMFYLTIEKPVVEVFADSQNPISGNTAAQTVQLSIKVDGEIVTNNVKYTIMQDEYGIVKALNETTGELQIKTGITAYNPTITISTQYSGFTPVNIAIYPIILVDEVRIANTDITQVEQGHPPYDFSAVNLPANAKHVDQAIEYKVNVVSDIAEISDDGRLEVKAAAPIGTIITITAVGADGTSKTHTVTVKTVYAADIRVNNENNQIVWANAIINFDVDFISQYNNVTESVKNYEVSLNDGDTSTAVISADKKYITIKSLAELILLDISKPTFTVKILSNQNGVELAEYRTFAVYIPVTNINISHNANGVLQEDFYNRNLKQYRAWDITSLVSTRILPNCSDLQSATYTIEGNNNYAWITDNKFLHIADKNILPNGNYTFVLKASAEDYSATVTFSIYIKTTTLTMTAENLTNSDYPYSPMSARNSSDQIRITTHVDEKATNQIPVLTVTAGSALIENWVYQNGMATFNIKPCVSGVIKIEAAQDGITTKLQDIVIYVPVESSVLKTSKSVVIDGHTYYYIVRGTANVLTPEYTGGATESGNNKFFIDSKGIATALTMTSITVPQNMSAGTMFSVTYHSLDRLGVSFISYFIIDELQKSDFNYLVNGTARAFPYDKDSSVMQIDENNPQLWVGRYTDIIVKYKGLPLNDYGLSVIDSNTTIKQAIDKARLSVNGDASGKTKISPTIIIKDGNNTTYTLTLPEISVFRPMSGTPSLSNGTVVANGTQLTLSDNSSWDEKATYVLDDLVFYGSSDDITVTTKGWLTISSASANASQIIILKCIQYYNGTGKVNEVEYYDNSLRQTIKRLSLDKQGGKDGSSDVLAVNGYGDISITIPTRTGYAFYGYFTSTTTTTKIFDYTGKKVYTNIGNLSNTKLYAYWVLCSTTSTITKEIYNDENTEGHNHTDYNTVSLDVSKLNEIGYTKITLSITISIKDAVLNKTAGIKSNKPGYGYIWIDVIEENQVWKVTVDTTNTDWHPVSYSKEVDIAEFGSGTNFKFRFGMESVGHTGGYDDSWSFQSGSVIFTAGGLGE